MELRLTEDDGAVLASWYIPDAEIEASAVVEEIETAIPCWYESKGDWKRQMKEEEERQGSLPPLPYGDIEF